MAGGEDDGRSSKGYAGGRSSPSESVEGSSPPSATRFVCEAGRPCEACLLYDTHKGKAKRVEAKKTADGSDGSSGSGGSSSTGDSEKSSSKIKTNSSTGAEVKTNSSTSAGSSQSLSNTEKNEGIETKGWGGVENETELEVPPWEASWTHVVLGWEEHRAPLPRLSI